MDPLNLYPSSSYTDEIFDHVMRKIIELYKRYMDEYLEAQRTFNPSSPDFDERKIAETTLNQLWDRVDKFLNYFRSSFDKMIPSYRSMYDSYLKTLFSIHDLGRLTTDQKWLLMNRILNLVPSLKNDIRRNQKYLNINPSDVYILRAIQEDQQKLETFTSIASVILNEYAKLGYTIDYFTLINRETYEIINRDLANMTLDVTPQNFELRTKSNINDYEHVIYKLVESRWISSQENTSGFVFPSLLDVPRRKYPGKVNINPYAEYYPFSDQTNPDQASPYQRVYYKNDIIDAISRLGFSVNSEDQNPKIMVSDLTLPSLLQPEDDIIPIVGFNDREHYVRTYNGYRHSHVKGDPIPTFLIYPTTFGRGYPTRLYNRHQSTITYYENIYRSLARTSQHLPWEGFIRRLEEHTQTKNRLRATGELPRKNYQDPNVRGKVIPLFKETLRFIATYDYQIPRKRVEGLTRLKICQIIHRRVQQIHLDALRLAEIKEIRPAFLGHYIPDSPWRKYSPNPIYLEHYGELIQLCDKIHQLKESGELDSYESIYRNELIRHIEQLDFTQHFVGPSINNPAKIRSLDDYPIDRLCKKVIDFIQDQITSRERIAEQDLRYL